VMDAGPHGTSFPNNPLTSSASGGTNYALLAVLVRVHTPGWFQNLSTTEPLGPQPTALPNILDDPIRIVQTHSQTLGVRARSA
jgi:hypothetical protein